MSAPNDSDLKEGGNQLILDPCMELAEKRPAEQNSSSDLTPMPVCEIEGFTQHSLPSCLETPRLFDHAC